jgi:hypothetical protein
MNISCSFLSGESGRKEGVRTRTARDHPINKAFAGERASSWRRCRR